MSKKGELRQPANSTRGIVRGRAGRIQAAENGRSTARSTSLVPASPSGVAPAPTRRGLAPRNADSNAVSSSSRGGTLFQSATDFNIHGGNFLSVTVNADLRNTGPQLGAASPSVFIHDGPGEEDRPEVTQKDKHTALPEISADLSSECAATIWPQTQPYPLRRSCDIYYQHIGAKGRGSPLWIPEPNKNLHINYQRKGLSVGDVGIITASGSFDFLFNICLPAEHPFNADELPKNFLQLSIKPADIQKQSEFKGERYLSSASVKKSHHHGGDSSDKSTSNSGLIFEASASEGAILTMPVGLNSEDLTNIRLFRKYAAAHAENWYRYIIDVRGREVKNGDVRLVIGHDKTTAWGMATFSNLTSQKDSFHLRFRPVEQSNVGRLYEWEDSSMAEVRAGPDAREIEALRKDDPEQQGAEYENQCLFLRSLNISLRDEVWKKLESELGEVEAAGDPGYTTYSDSMFSAQSPPGSSSSSSVRPSLPGPDSTSHGQSQYSLTSSKALTGHPSESINKMLLKLHPNARMAITDDQDWISVLNEDDSVLPPAEEVCARIMASFVVREEEDIVFLEKEIQSSREPAARQSPLTFPRTSHLPEGSKEPDAGAGAAIQDRRSQKKAEEQENPNPEAQEIEHANEGKYTDASPSESRNTAPVGGLFTRWLKKRHSTTSGSIKAGLGDENAYDKGPEKIMAPAAEEESEAATSLPPPVKVKKQSQSCDPCRARKVRCTRENEKEPKSTCKHCVALGIPCTYDFRPPMRGPANLYLRRLQEAAPGQQQYQQVDSSLDPEGAISSSETATTSPRKPQSCDVCRVRKVRCVRENRDDPKQSCKHCVTLGIPCTYDYRPMREAPNLYLKHLQEEAAGASHQLQQQLEGSNIATPPISPLASPPLRVVSQSISSKRPLTFVDVEDDDTPSQGTSLGLMAPKPQPTSETVDLDITMPPDSIAAGSSQSTASPSIGPKNDLSFL